MDIRLYENENEKPLDILDPTGGFAAIFRTIGCVGDSLSSGEFEGTNEKGEKTYHDFFEYSWGQFLARMLGSKVYNFSRGGMTAEAYCKSFAEANGFWGTDKLCDAYIFALGVNDISCLLRGEIELGSIDDIDPDDCEKNKATIVGYYAKIIGRLRRNRPDAFFFLMTPPKEDNLTPERAEKVKLLCDEIRKLKDVFPRTYLLDFDLYAPLYDDGFRRTFFLGGHLNPAGYLLTARMVASYIDYIIRHNMDDFKQVGFIGTPHKNTTDTGAFEG